MNTIKILCMSIALFISSFLVLPSPAYAQDPWDVWGTGTSFEVTDSPFRDFRLTSDLDVTVYVISEAHCIEIEVEGCSGGEPSASLTISGLPANTCHYRYQNGNLIEDFFTDNNGAYSWVQDCTVPCHLWIKDQPSTIHLYADGVFSPSTAPVVWDPGSQTYTLTGDVHELLQFDTSNVTLDGDGYTLFYGTYCNGKTGVTIKNCIFSGSSAGAYGIRFWNCPNCTIKDNVLTNSGGGRRAMQLDYFRSGTITGNTVSHWDVYGICFAHCWSNAVTGNLFDDNGRAIMLALSGSNFEYNTFQHSRYHNITFYWISVNSTFSHNNFLNPSNKQLYYGYTSSLITWYKFNTETGRYEGNYWSNYAGIDLNGDGLGDTNLPCFRDNYPFIKQDGWISNQPPVANAGSDQSVYRGSMATLNGTSSHDPEEDYPLTFAWSFVDFPTATEPVLLDESSSQSSFLVEAMGDYILELVVTDATGLESDPATVRVTTLNASPVADAGDDVVIRYLGTLVQLDGSQSWDPETDSLWYDWTIVQKPVGSAAALDDPGSPTPTFTADVLGSYELSLTVRDLWNASQPDNVTVSLNAKPVADAGANQSLLVNQTVNLDGSASSDLDGDPLTYSWSLVSSPPGSLAQISGPGQVQASVVVDVPGEYIVSLVVNDGRGDSEPDNITIVAISYRDALIVKIEEVQDSIDIIPRSVFKNRHLGKAMTNKVNAVLEKVDRKLYSEAHDKLKNDILKKTDGFVETGAPDLNDWILDAARQAEVHTLVTEALALLDSLN